MLEHLFLFGSPALLCEGLIYFPMRKILSRAYLRALGVFSPKSRACEHAAYAFRDKNYLPIARPNDCGFRICILLTFKGVAAHHAGGNWETLITTPQFDDMLFGFIQGNATFDGDFKDLNTTHDSTSLHSFHMKIPSCF
jgi:hypothetical protein